MKIVGVSNYALDHVSDKLIAENIPNEVYADLMCAALNKDVGEGSMYYYVVREDSYQLYKWEP